MKRLLMFLTLALGGSCAPSDDDSVDEVRDPDVVANSSADTSAFHFNETNQKVFLDTRAPPGQRRRFDIGLGSITVETVNAKDNRLIFHYTPEVEGGYTIYECAVPITPNLVEFEINSDGTPGKTSFDLSKCKVIRSGNVLLE